MAKYYIDHQPDYPQEKRYGVYEEKFIKGRNYGAIKKFFHTEKEASEFLKNLTGEMPNDN